MKPERRKLVAAMGLVLGVLALYAAAKGIWDGRIYREAYLSGALAKRLVAGSVAQDMVSLGLGCVLILVSLGSLVRESEVFDAVLLGLSAYLFYAYGLYVIQGQYTSVYPVYLVIFSLALYAMIAGFSGMKEDRMDAVQFPKWFRMTVSAFLMAVVLFLAPAWIGMMLKDVGRRLPGDTYAVFVLDLAVVFPALTIAAVSFYRGKSFGKLLAGAGLVKCFTVCLSVTAGEWISGLGSATGPDGVMLVLFGILTAVSMGLAAVYEAYVGKAGMPAFERGTS